MAQIEWPLAEEVARVIVAVAGLEGDDPVLMAEGGYAPRSRVYALLALAHRFGGVHPAAFGRLLGGRSGSSICGIARLAVLRKGLNWFDLSRLNVVNATLGWPSMTTDEAAIAPLATKPARAAVNKKVADWVRNRDESRKIAAARNTPPPLPSEAQAPKLPAAEPTQPGARAAQDTPTGAQDTPPARAPDINPLGPDRDEIDDAPPRPFLDRFEPPTGAGAAILGLQEHHCRWPIGEPKDANFRFCRALTPPDREPRYCDRHAALHPSNPSARLLLAAERAVAGEGAER